VRFCLRARIEIRAEAMDVRLGLMAEAPLSLTTMLKLGTLLMALGSAEAADRPTRVVAARRADDSRLDAWVRYVRRVPRVPKPTSVRTRTVAERRVMARSLKSRARCTSYHLTSRSHEASRLAASNVRRATCWAVTLRETLTVLLVPTEFALRLTRRRARIECCRRRVRATD
jgi:hypothetical protein